MKTIIAEKYSYAKNIRRALETRGEAFETRMNKANGWFESDEYIITWCFGHLFRLQDMNAYLGRNEKTRWELADLPFFPERFVFVLKDDSGAKTQYQCIRKCLDRADSIICAGDADREGQLIVDTVLAKSGCKKPAMRLWTGDQTPSTIAAALDEMKSNASYRALLGEGYARTCMDWVYGINLTRYASLRAGSLMRIGRVIVPVVQEIVKREREIESFVPEKLIRCVSETECKGVPLVLKSKAKLRPGDPEADRICREYNAAGGTVTDASRERKSVRRPKLYSLGSLQSDLGKEMDMKEVLACAQSLYEKGLISYPRASAEHLFPTEKEKIRELLKNYPGCAFRDSPEVFSAKKNDGMSHSAIVPTGKKPEGSLSEKERTVYERIANRFRAAFWKEERTVDRRTVTISVCGEEFTVTGDALIDEGWGNAEKAALNSRQVPDLSKGDHVETDFKKKDEMTSPPRRFTVKTLNAFMENPYSKEEKTDVQLGTEATRAGIIDNAIRSGYVSLKKGTYYAMDEGKRLVDTADALGLGIDKGTSLEFAEMLVAVREGKMSAMQAVKKSEKAVAETIEKANRTKTVPAAPERESLGKCPLCGRPVREIKTAKYHFYSCSGYRKDDPASCKFSMRADYDRFGDRISITPKRMTALLEGRTFKATLTSKSGKKYKADVKLEMNGHYANLRPVFSDRENKK